VTTDAERIAAVAASPGARSMSLSPVIGPGGVAALYQRALALDAPRLPKSDGDARGPAATGDFAAIAAALAPESAEQVAAANGALLQAFCDLLAT